GIDSPLASCPPSSAAAAAAAAALCIALLVAIALITRGAAIFGWDAARRGFPVLGVLPRRRDGSGHRFLIAPSAPLATAAATAPLLAFLPLPGGLEGLG